MTNNETVLTDWTIHAKYRTEESARFNLNHGFRTADDRIAALRVRKLDETDCWGNQWAVEFQMFRNV